MAAESRLDGGRPVHDRLCVVLPRIVLVRAVYRCWPPIRRAAPWSMADGISAWRPVGASVGGSQTTRPPRARHTTCHRVAPDPRHACGACDAALVVRWRGPAVPRAAAIVAAAGRGPPAPAPGGLALGLVLVAVAEARLAVPCAGRAGSAWHPGRSLRDRRRPLRPPAPFATAGATPRPPDAPRNPTSATSPRHATTPPRQPALTAARRQQGADGRNVWTPRVRLNTPRQSRSKHVLRASRRQRLPQRSRPPLCHPPTRALPHQTPLQPLRHGTAAASSKRHRDNRPSAMHTTSTCPLWRFRLLRLPPHGRDRRRATQPNHDRSITRPLGAGVVQKVCRRRDSTNAPPH